MGIEERVVCGRWGEARMVCWVEGSYSDHWRWPFGSEGRGVVSKVGGGGGVV